MLSLYIVNVLLLVLHIVIYILFGCVRSYTHTCIFSFIYTFYLTTFSFSRHIDCQSCMTTLILCLDGYEPGPIQLGPVQVSPEQIFLLVYIEIFRSEQMTHAIS